MFSMAHAEIHELKVGFLFYDNQKPTVISWISNSSLVEAIGSTIWIMTGKIHWDL